MLTPDHNTLCDVPFMLQTGNNFTDEDLTATNDTTLCTTAGQVCYTASSYDKLDFICVSFSATKSFRNPKKDQESAGKLYKRPVARWNSVNRRSDSFLRFKSSASSFPST